MCTRTVGQPYVKTMLIYKPAAARPGLKPAAGQTHRMSGWSQGAMQETKPEQ